MPFSRWFSSNRALALPEAPDWQKSVRHCLPSYILSMDDDAHGPDDKLMQTAFHAATWAWENDLAEVAARFSEPQKTWIQTFPGEHYRLLAGLVKVLNPALCIEIGTYQGAGALSILHSLLPGSKLITYDILPYTSIEGCVLTSSDFGSRLEQRLADVSTTEAAAREKDTLSKADFIFVDAAKTGDQERAFIQLFDQIDFEKPPLIFFDDIRFENMIPIWRSIRHPKLDLTSFGHWSGSGLVHWTHKSKVRA